MKKIFKNFVLCVVITALFVNLTFFAASSNTMPINAPSAPEIKENCTSAILMEADTGSVLYEHNADAPLPPASVTKVMTLLLVMEAIDDGKINYNDMVSASAHACSMGGSQIYLKEGELMSVEDLLKSVVIASANDAAVALAEYVAGSEDAFVALMNEKAKELGMLNTNFENTNGLDDTAKAHYTSARDIAIMSRELIKHKKIVGRILLFFIYNIDGLLYLEFLGQHSLLLLYNICLLLLLRSFQMTHKISPFRFFSPFSLIFLPSPPSFTRTFSARFEY